MQFNLLILISLSFQVAPVTIHPAFEKGAAYFDLKIVHVPIKNYRVDMTEYEKVCL